MLTLMRMALDALTPREVGAEPGWLTKLADAGAAGLTVPEFEQRLRLNRPGAVAMLLLRAMEAGDVEAAGTDRYRCTAAYHDRRKAKARAEADQTESAKIQRAQTAATMARMDVERELAQYGPDARQAGAALAIHPRTFTNQGGAFVLHYHPLRVRCVGCGEAVEIKSQRRITFPHLEHCEVKASLDALPKDAA